MNSVSNVENLSPQIIRRIVKEMHEITTCSPEGIKLQINDADVTDIQAVLEGPPGTPYAGGSFRIKLNLGKHFPTSPPKAYFLTKIFHPNVAANGEICVNTLKKDWTPDLGIKHILLTIKCLLIVPNPESALNEEAGKLLLEQYDDYCRRARMMTEIHAPPILKSGKNTSSTDSDDQQQTQQSGKWTTNNSINNNSNNINNNTINSISNNNNNISNNSLNINNNLNNINNNNNITNITNNCNINNNNNNNNINNANTESTSNSGDGGPLLKKHAVDLKRLQDKKKEKLLKEKKRNLKRL